MGIFKRGSKQLQGVITEARSGYTLTLPGLWKARDMGKSMFLLSGRGRDEGMITWSVEHLVAPEKGRNTNPFTGEELNVEYTREGDYNTFEIEGPGEREWAKAWHKETNRHLVRFMFMCPKSKKQQQMETVLQIINSLDTSSSED